MPKCKSTSWIGASPASSGGSAQFVRAPTPLSYRKAIPPLPPSPAPRYLAHMKTILRFFARPLLHFLYFIPAGVAGFFGVFYVGVPAYGDNPGAMIGGIAVFALTYGGLVGAEAFFASWRRRQPLLDCALEVVFAGAAFIAASIVAEQFGFQMLGLIMGPMTDPNRIAQYLAITLGPLTGLFLLLEEITRRTLGFGWSLAKKKFFSRASAS